MWSAMLEAYNKLKTKPKAIGEVKKALPVILGNMPQGQGCERLIKISD